MSISDKSGGLENLLGREVFINLTTGELEMYMNTREQTWDEIEKSELRGIELLQVIIDSMEDLPVQTRIKVVHRAEYDSSYLQVAYKVPNAYDLSDKDYVQYLRVEILCCGRYPGQPEPTARQWAAWLLHTLSFIAVHEVAEFFVVGGVRIFDPHSGNQLRLINPMRSPLDF